MLYSEYISYFRNIAIKLKSIGHTDEVKRFTRINIEEVLNSSMTLDLNNVCMTLEAYETGVDNNFSDNLRDIKTGALMILKHATSGDLDSQDSVLSETEQVVLSIISKMKKDMRDNVLIKHLDLGSLQINKVGPVFDNCFGWRLTFSFDESLNANVVYKTSDWLD